MTYKTLYALDPWPDKCPELDDLTTTELLTFLENAEDGHGITDWEQAFCRSIRNQLWKGWTLSEKQRDVFEKGLLKKLWNADPELWRDSYCLMFPEIEGANNGKTQRR